MSKLERDRDRYKNRSRPLQINVRDFSVRQRSNTRIHSLLSESMFGSGPQGLVAGLVVFLSGSLGHAAVLHVPGDYSAIQSAIDNSANGDVILVNPGVYNESIIFKGK